MGIYINPKTDRTARDKAQTIAAVGRRVTSEQFLQHIPGNNDEVGVAILDNGMFVAAGIAFSKDEAKAFIINDGRSVAFFILSLARIDEMDVGAGRAAREVIKKFSHVGDH